MLNCVVYADPKELKRLRAREHYSQNKDEINKRRREAYQQKKKATAESKGLEDGTHTLQDMTPVYNMMSHTPATGQSAVTQLQQRICADGVISNSLRPSQLILDKENIYEDDDDQWLHRNDSYQMQQNSRRKRDVVHAFGTDPQTISSLVTDSTQGNVV